MKQKLAIVIGAVSAYLIFVIALLPAKTAIGWFSLPKNVELGFVSGSVWHSQISEIRIQGISINQVQAEVSLLSLLTFAPSVDLTFGTPTAAGPSGSASVTLAGNTVQVNEANISMAASEIAPLLPLPIPVNAFGGVKLTVKELAVSQTQCLTADAKVAWQRAAVNALEQDIELGDFAADIQCEKDNLVVNVVPENRLGLTVSTQIQMNGRFSGEGYLQPGAEFPAELKQALPFLGNADAQGRYRLKF
ncbi:type II secretion system protein N [Colwellia sp. MEBiC06753]